ncbi:MAG TPA: DUF4395 family protein [Patescibacteria group bacterium]|nr:DUF4395 family protein [Patescibacteria group bacterium]
MASQIVRNFMKQQGFPDEAIPTCDMHFAGLYFQPRIVGTLLLVAIILASPVLFLVLSGALWWNVLVPALNPFELIYNRLIAVPRGKTVLTPSPAPRRFAQAMAAAMMLIVALALLQGWVVTAWVFEAFLVAAFSLLLFGRFCLGAYIYHLLRGRISFANATLPWARSR